MQIKQLIPAWLLLAAAMLIHSGPAALASNQVIYNGLVTPQAGVITEQSGFLTITLSGNGKFTGKIFISNGNAQFHGKFNSSGSDIVYVKVSTGGQVYCGCGADGYEEEKRVKWVLDLQLTPDREHIVGLVYLQRDNGWISNLSLDRAGYSSTNPAPQAGKYTFVIPGQVPGVPGSGIGTLTVDSNGRVDLLGALADGTKINRVSVLNKDGSWPVFSSLYSGKGMVLGWLTFTNLSDTDLAGQLTWTKPYRPDTAFNPEGFTNDVVVVGSQYTPPTVLSLTNGLIVFEEGSLGAPFTNSVTLSAGNKVSNNSSNKLTLKINTKNGRFEGEAQDPATGESFPYKGAVFQKQNSGPGYFRWNSQLGNVLLEPAP